MSISKKISNGISSIGQLLLPSYCIVCEKRTDDRMMHICPTCLARLPLYHGMEPIYHGHQRLEGHVPFTEYESDLVFNPANATRRLIHLIKYKGYPQLGYHQAHAHGAYHRAAGHYSDISLVIPIPTTPERLRRRGYNQAEYIARGLAAHYPKMRLVTDVLYRAPSRGTQTHRSMQGRWQAMKGVFGIQHPERIAHKRVLIVDDVLTTGATLTSAADCLLQAGVEAVSYYTLAIDTYLK